MSAGDNSNFVSDDNFKMAQQQQFGRSTVNSGRFSTYLAGSSNAGSNVNNGNGTGGGPSTSSAAGLLTNTNSRPSTSKSNGNSSNSSSMTLAKYNSSNKNNGHDDIMRLSTALVTEKYKCS